MTAFALPPFSAVLRARTAAVHADTEAAPFLLALSEGRVTGAGVVGLLQRLLPVYEALEELGRQWAADPAVGPLLVPGLERVPALRQDLDRLAASETVDSPAASAYAARIRAVGACAPSYVAHHYTRYLGDLSGGQIIAAALRRTGGPELAFLAFPGLRGPAVKKAYRAHLDTLPWTAAEQELAVAEADLAFRCNAALAAELEAEVPGA